MNLWNQIKSIGQRIWPNGTSRGEQILVAAMGAWQSLLGTWGSNRHEQVRHDTGWNYIGTKIVCEEFAMVPPQVAYILPPEQATAERRALGRFMTKAMRRKILANVQEHEELELVDSDHRLYQLLRNPNPVDTGYDLWNELCLYLEVCGNSYLWKVRDVLGMVKELWVLPANWVRPRTNTLDGSMPTKFVEWYEVNPKGFLTGSGFVRIPAEDIIPFMYKNPANKFDGLAPTQAVAPWIDVAESIDLSQFASFKNRAVTDVVIELDPKFSDPKKDDLKRAQQEFKDKYGGEGNVGVPWILAPGASAKKLSPTPAEMDYVRSAEQARDWCLAARRVSKIIAGIDEAGSYNNMITSTANFVMRTMKPKRMMVGQRLTENLAKEFDVRLCIFWPDTTPEDPAQVLAERTAMLEHAVITQNEWRADIGKEPFPHGGDEPMYQGQEQGWVSGKKPLDLASLMGQMGQKPGLPGTRDEEKEGNLKFWMGKTTDASGHEHAADGKFGTGGHTDAKPLSAGSGKLHANAAKACKSWTERAKAVPAAIMTKAKDKAKSTYTKLEGRYGKPAALAIIGAGILGAPLPIPGSSLMTAAPVLAAAELYLRMKGHKSIAYMLKGTDWTDQMLMEEGRKFIEELNAGWDEKRLTVEDLRHRAGLNGYAKVG